MANELQLDILKREGTAAWNRWRQSNPDKQPELTGAELIQANLRGANLRGANLSGADLGWANLNRADLLWANLKWAYLCGANLRGANLSGAELDRADLSWAYLNGADLSWAYLNGAGLIRANLSGANLKWANLNGADLSWANLSGADLSWANFNGAELSGANLSGADLSDTDLTNAHLVETNFENATLIGCELYGISAWRLKLQNAKQEDLIITPRNEPTITVDNLEVAQFIYLLLYNEKIRDIIDTITSKVVLILGRFTQERKAMLDAIREELRKHNYLPVLFDFEKPASRDITETVSTLAHMARFIIADITDARSIPQELAHIVPDLPSVPVQPLLQLSADKYGMFEHFESYPWVLEIYRYEDIDDLLKSLEGKVIAPAEAKATQLGRRG